MLTHALAAEPNLRWCEAHVAGPILEPNNSWTSLAYVMVGLLVLADRRQGLLRGYSPVLAIVGATSFAYHATWTVGSQLMDYAGMLTLTGWLTAMAAVRLRWLTEGRVVGFVATWVFGWTATVAGLVSLGGPVQLVIITQALSILGLELHALRHRGGDGRLFGLAVVTLLASAAMSALDASRVLCDPHDHLAQAHGAWHVGSAAHLGLMYLFHRGVSR